MAARPSRRIQRGVVPTAHLHATPSAPSPGFMRPHAERGDPPHRAQGLLGDFTSSRSLLPFHVASRSGGVPTAAHHPDRG